MAKQIPVLAALILGLLSAPALAGPIVSFSDNLGGGSISYAGSGSNLVGANIPIDTVTGIGTPQHSGNPGSSITQGTLSFTTGNLVSFSSGVYTFGAGGTFTITGGMPAASIANGTTLLTGQLSTAAVDVGSSVYLFTGSGIDTPNQALLAYFGLTGSAATLGQVTIHISPTTACSPCGRGTPFAGSPFSIYVPDAPTPVPEPGTLALLGSGLLGIAMAAGRRFART